MTKNQFAPESLAQFNPESLAHFNPEYPNNTNRTFSFNEFQQNIMLLDANNSELTYTIAEAKTINTGDNRRTEIQFSIIGQFHATKLKFSSLNECIYVEL